jgi:Zn-dependent protease
MFDFYGFGLYVGDVAGIRVRLHWLLLLWWVNDLIHYTSIRDESRTLMLAAWAISVLITFLSIFLHELGHCFAARRVGGYADEILMWPLGGLAFCSCPDTWRCHLIVAAAGPLVTAVIGFGGWGLTYLLEAGNLSWTSHPLYMFAKWDLVSWNLRILIFNLIPLYPLDGGRIFHSITWRVLAGSRGQGWGARGRANRITVQVSYVTAAACIVYGLWREDMFTVIIGVWALLGIRNLTDQAHF